MKKKVAGILSTVAILSAFTATSFAASSDSATTIGKSDLKVTTSPITLPASLQSTTPTPATITIEGDTTVTPLNMQKSMTQYKYYTATDTIPGTISYSDSQGWSGILTKTNIELYTGSGASAVWRVTYQGIVTKDL